MSYSFGERFKVTVFGQSHSDGIGVVIDGIAAGTEINTEFIEEELSKRRPGKNSYSTKRKEDDEFEILSGIVDGKTCGAPLCFLIKNRDFISKDYSELKYKPRPSHADYPAYVKYNGFNDISGGGQFSGRLTAPLTIAGAIAKDMLSKKKIKIISRIKSIYDIEDEKIDYNSVKLEDLISISKKEFPVIDNSVGDKMINFISDVSKNGDSVGGIAEVFAFGLPVGVGEPLYDSVESVISSRIFSVPGVRGIEFGLGFDASKTFGSVHNDEYYYDGEEVRTTTNNHGGVIGGITTGMPLVFRVAIKPTSSISKKQNTINIKDNTNCHLEILGRHDPCIVPRVIPVLESVTAIGILDLMMIGGYYELR